MLQTKIENLIKKHITKFLLGCLLFFMFLPLAIANNNSNNQNSANSFAGSDSNAGAMAGVNIDSHDTGYSHNPAVDLSKTVPNSIAPNPHVGQGVCDSAYTFSIGWSGLGVGFGVPVSDEDCNRREDAKTVKGIGAPEVAFEVMCNDIRVFRASYRAGRPCYPSEELVDELKDDEIKLMEGYIEQERLRKEAEEKRRKIIENNFYR